jgi:hypothetical protein
VVTGKATEGLDSTVEKWEETEAIAHQGFEQQNAK